MRTRCEKSTSKKPSFEDRETFEMQKKYHLLIGFGSLFEYYDFVIYGMMLPYLTPLFFKSFSGEESLDGISTFYALAGFFIAYLVRPLGGILFGIMADKKGRKKTLLQLMFLMGISTFLIGCLPTPEEGSIFPGILLLILRALQGISFGAELPAAMTALGELEQNKIEAKSSGFIISNTAMGAILASAVLYGLSSFYQEEAINAFAWRIPFLMGGILCLGLYLLRHSLKESPLFVRSAPPQSLKKTFLSKETVRTLFYAVGATLTPTTLVVSNIMFPLFLNTHFHYALPDIYGTTVLSLVWSAVVAFWGGKFIDQIGKHLFLKKLSIFFVPAVGIILFLITREKWFCLLLALVLYQTWLTLFVTLLFPLIFSAFRKERRATSLGLTYNMGYGLASLLVTGLFLLGDRFVSLPLAPVGIGWIVASFLSLFFATRLKQSLFRGEENISSIDQK